MKQYLSRARKRWRQQAQPARRAEKLFRHRIHAWRLLGYLSIAGLLLLSSEPASAATPTGRSEIGFALDSFFLLTQAFLVFWMAAGFAMLEAGMVRTKNVSAILLKNISLFAVAGFAYFLIGYDLMYVEVTGWFGSLGIWGPNDAAILSDHALEGTASGADWLFQMVFVATAASIVSGTLAERIRLIPFLMFVMVLTGLLYPVVGSWVWGGGWLADIGFTDFAGSTIVHSVGGWAALTGAIVLGPRRDKFKDGTARHIPPSSMPLATLGTFILWLGWLGFNGGSQLAISSAEDAVAVSIIYVNTMLAPIGGVLAALTLTTIFYKKADLTMVLNGALAGLVSITANPATVDPLAAIVIGAVGGCIVVAIVPILERVGIDDVVGAIPVHLVAGIWGTLVAGVTNPEGSLIAQIVGIVATGAFVAGTGLLTWLLLRRSVRLRPSHEEESLGLDHVELGVSAYPEFRTHYI